MGGMIPSLGKSGMVGTAQTGADETWGNLQRKITWGAAYARIACGQNHVLDLA